MFPHRYRKVSAVLAARAESSGVIRTPEGAMRYAAGDYLVTDTPPTHVWPVRRDVFETTYAADDHLFLGDLDAYARCVADAKRAASSDDDEGSRLDAALERGEI